MSFKTFSWRKFAILANLLQPYFWKKKTLLPSLANFFELIPNLLGQPVLWNTAAVFFVARVYHQVSSFATFILFCWEEMKGVCKCIGCNFIFGTTPPSTTITSMYLLHLFNESKILTYLRWKSTKESIPEMTKGKCKVFEEKVT